MSYCAVINMVLRELCKYCDSWAVLFKTYASTYSNIATHIVVSICLCVVTNFMKKNYLMA